MEKLTNLHQKALALYLTFPVASFTLILVCIFVFRIFPPFWLIASVALTGVLIAAIMKFKFWLRRFEVLDKDALQSKQARIIFGSIPVELAFWLIAMLFIISAD